MTKILSALILSAVSCCIITDCPLYAAPPSVESSSVSIKIKISNFRDRSGYDGPWNLSAGIGDMFRKSLGEIGNYQIAAGSLSYSADGDILLAVGTIEKFEIQSEGLTSYGVGGYERYRSTVELELKIHNSTGGAVLGIVRGKGETVRSNLGLSFLGGPVGGEHTKKEIDRMWTLRFDSDETRNSIVGESIQKAIDDLIVQMSLGIMNIPLGLKGSIVKMRGTQAYVDLGTENSISPGQVFHVYSRREKIINTQTGKILGNISPVLVGRIKIIEVSDKRFSAAEIIEGRENIQEKDMVVLK